MNINGTHGMYVVYVYGEGGGHLPSNWNGVVIMTFPIRRVMVHPPWRGGFAFPADWEKDGGDKP